jgi:hypothetical protein
MEEIGMGVLDWDRKERISDRYGLVVLFDGPSDPRNAIQRRRAREGEYGRLIAVVSETRQPSHIGDLFHNVFPSKPAVNETVVLGEGTLFFAGDGVGVLPEDNRRTLWLDIRALYHVHNQTVRLFFDKAALM